MTDFGPYTMRGLKTCRARNGYAWSATLYRDGRRIGDVQDAGNGGALYVTLEPDEDRALAAHAGAQPYPDVGPGETHDTETFLAALADWTEAQAKARRLLARRVVMIDGGAARSFTRVQPTPANVAGLSARYPGVVDPAAPDAVERVARALCGGAP